MSAPVLITGSTGFLGSYTVAAALRAGLTVRALVRPGTADGALPWGEHPRLQIAKADLRDASGLAEVVRGVDAVVHLAAVKSGPLAERFAGTVVTTENLLTAMTAAQVYRMVLCSSFSVYDYRAMPLGGELTETSPVEDEPATRDEYAQVKLEQERLVREWGGRTTVLRPGMIYGPGELWHALLGVELAGPVWLGVGSRRRLPMTWVENVADAFVAALGHETSTGETVNIVDDSAPTVRAYRDAVAPFVGGRPRMVPVPYPLMSAAVTTLGRANQRFLDGGGKLPNGFLPASFAARFRPLTYPNQHAERVLGWRPRVSLAEALARAASSVDLVRVES